ncbi:uncharacterized protein LOC117122236 [Anneissia japonica]|uniref:uncharacterized protein LOC117122236 n=1 Tax=Anneissia japonica TaxID=1529436 RepID=UPI001425AD4D|nr:uncharacterized protein LOC117122236 [Anneissia japonica]
MSYRCNCEFMNNQYYECVLSTASSTTRQNYTKKSSSTEINQCCGEQYVLSSFEDRISCFSSFDSWVPSGEDFGHGDGSRPTTGVTSGLGDSHSAGSSADAKSGVGIGLGAENRLNILTKPQTSAAGMGLVGTFQTTVCTCQADITDQQTTYSCVYKTGDGVEESQFLSISTDSRINQCCTEARDNVLACMNIYDGIGISTGGSSAIVSGAGASRKTSAGAGVVGTSVSGPSASTSGVSGSGVSGATAGISTVGLSGTVDSQVNKYTFGNGFDLQRNRSLFSSEHSEAHQCNCRSLLVNTERMYKCNITYKIDSQATTIEVNSSSAEIFKCCDAVLPIDVRVSCLRLFQNMDTNTFGVTDNTERIHGYLNDHVGVSESTVATDVTMLVPSERAVKEWLQQLPNGNINKITARQVIKGGRYSAEDFAKNVSLPELYNTIQLMEQTCAVIVKSSETNEGVLHTLNKVLDPPHSTVYDVIMNDDRFSILASIINRFDSTKAIIHGDDFTLLAPTDDAFANVEDLESLIEEDIKEFILYHIIEKRQCCHELIPRELPSRRMTAVGKTVMVQRIRYGYGIVNRSRVTECDITAENGVIHTINAVLKP